MSQEQTPIQKKIIEWVEKQRENHSNYISDPNEIETSNIHLDGWFNLDDFAMFLAQYIKDEVVPGKSEATIELFGTGFNTCRSKVVDKFKEMGI